MLNLFFGFVLLFGIKSNIVLNSGSGALLFQKEKQYLKFRTLNSLFVALGTFVCLVISYFLTKYIYEPNDMLYLSVVITVLLVGVYNIIVSKIFAKMSHFVHYLYEKSHSFAIDTVFILSVIFSISVSYVVVEFVLLAAAIAIITFVTNMIFGFFVEDANKSSVDRHYLNVPSRLFMLAIFSIILYYAAQLIK